MGIFAWGTRAPTDSPGPWGPGTVGEGAGAWRQHLPPRSVSVGEALARGTGVLEACRRAGGADATSGRSMEEALESLAHLTREVAGREPDFAETAAVAVAWAEATLGYLHRLSCTDPLTGLASLAHLQARVADLYRAADPATPAGETHALVVVEPGFESLGLAGSLRLAALGDAARTAFPGGETVARVGRRVVVLAARRGLELRTSALRELPPLAGPRVGVRVEGLPGTDGAAAAALDELARS